MAPSRESRRSSDDSCKYSRSNSRLDLPISAATTTETASRPQNASSASSLSSLNSHAHEPNWPREWRAYMCLLGCFFLMFNSWGLVNAYGTFASYYVGHSLRNSDQLELNLIGSTQSFLVLLFSAPAGRLLDAGHFRVVIGTGAVLVPLGMFMLSLAHPRDENALGNYATIWATQGFLVGLGMACYFVSSSQVAATWFPNRKGLAVGFVACGASIAGVVYPTMTRYLIVSLGFATAVRLVATLVLLTSIFSFIFSSPNPAHSHPKPTSYFAVKTWIDKEAFHNKAFLWFTAAVAFMFFGFYPVFFNLEEWAAVSGYGTRDGSVVPLHIAESTNKPLQTFWLLTIMNGASTVGRLTMAAFSDKTGQLNMHIVSQIVSSLLIFVLWTLAGSTAAAIAFCVLFGIFSGAVIGLPPASMANILSCTYDTPETKALAHSKLGSWTGMMYTMAAIPSLVGPVIVGHLVTQYSTYVTAQVWSGAMLLLSALCMLMSRWNLPCVDGEHVWTKMLRTIGKGSKADRWSEKMSTGNETASEADYSTTVRGISQATTRVPSTSVSQKVSSEKFAKLEPTPEQPERMV
ncbi:major facilitator superfamily domain-containing protein [Massariosphaeria phaeospora]|uniref:Major facilitator superfamily domain-containing protein n=1 Tax=Massariosphaeria phaeospora TaxID=100035 RepID=A0A7C8I272_9PLEO|nr:major facilitator superfamily domain-containing protein [Massariosphaeria phaeospora]